MKFTNPVRDMIARMSVGRQLAIAFGTLLPLLTAVARGVALDSLRRVHGGADALASKWLVGAGLIALQKLSKSPFEGGAAAAADSRQFYRLAFDAARIVHSISDGDLATPVPGRAGHWTSLFARLGTMQQRLAEAVESVRRGAENVATASGQIAQGNRDLSVTNGMDAPTRQRHQRARVEVSSTTQPGRGVQHADYDSRDRSCEECFPGPRCE